MRDVVADDQHRDICCAVDCDPDMLFRMSDADWNTRPIEDALRAENERLRADLEQTRVQLAGCGVIAMCNTENSLREQMPAPGSYGYSASLADVKRAVRREIVLRAAAQEALAVLTRLADSAAYWSNYDVPVGLVAEVDAAKARLAGVLGE